MDIRIVNIEDINKNLNELKKINKYSNNNNLLNAYNEGINKAKKIINEQPTAKSVIFAHWIYDENGVPHCSNCGTEDALSRDDYECRGGKVRNNNSFYCPWCGAEMD